MKQSSIEQLFDEIFKIPFNTPEAEDLYCEIMDLKEKYKQIHKQEITDAWNNGFREFYDGSSTPEEYYNTTFKSE